MVCHTLFCKVVHFLMTEYLSDSSLLFIHKYITSLMGNISGLSPFVIHVKSLPKMVKGNNNVFKGR